MEDNSLYLKMNQYENSESLQEIQLENTIQSQILGQSVSQDIKIHESPIQWGYVIDTNSKLDIKLQDYESKPATITVIKIGGIEDLNPLNFTVPSAINGIHQQVIMQDKLLIDQIQQNAMPLTKIPKQKPKKKYPPQPPSDAPAVICQNCDASFSTKYQFQRHQCEFNASKVILKSELPKKQIEKPKTKHECDICHKSFMTDHNLDRHRLSHGDKKPFTCQNCGKGFILESRLNTHVESHCKLSTNEPRKFYKTNLSVWQCWNCQLITATEPLNMIHVCDPVSPTFVSSKIIVSVENDSAENKENMTPNDSNTLLFESKDIFNVDDDQKEIKNFIFKNHTSFTTAYDENNLNPFTENELGFISTQNNFDENFEKAIDKIDITSQEEPNFYKQTTVSEKKIVILPEKNEHTFKIISVEQLFQCEFCNRTYANKEILKEHQNSHGTDKNYQCMFCNESFESYTNALIHWQHKCDNKTNLFCLPRIIICKFCDKGFKSHELLYAHKYKLKHFVPKVFSEIKQNNLSELTASINSDINTSTNQELSISQIFDCNNSQSIDEVKPDLNLTVFGEFQNSSLFSNTDQNGVHFEVNSNFGTISISDYSDDNKTNNSSNLQLDVTNNSTFQMPDNGENITQLQENLKEISNEVKIAMEINTKGFHDEDIPENISPLHDNCTSEITQIDAFLNDIANKVLDTNDVVEQKKNNDNIKLAKNNGEEKKILETVQQTPEAEKDNNNSDISKPEDDSLQIRKKLRSCTKKNNEKEDISKVRKKTTKNVDAKKYSRTSKEIVEDGTSRVCTRNMERLRNKKGKSNEKKNKESEDRNKNQGNIKEKYKEDNNSLLIVTEENQVYLEEKKKCSKRKLNDTQLEYNKENEIDDENSITIKDEPIIEDVVNEERKEEIKVPPVTPAKRGRKPKPKLPKNEIVLLCGEGYRFQCEKCAKVTRSIDELIEHRQSDHGSNFDCKDCGQVVHSAKALMIHCRAHQSLKPFVCDQCGRCYSQTSHLWQHMRFHQGIKPFACPHEGCEARYTIRPDLKDHIRKVHTRERPFRCGVCGKCFLTGSVYYQHRLIHNNDRRYGCDICDKRFFRADALNNHRRIHTDERPFPCPVCGREFRQKGDRNKHHRTQHPTEAAITAVNSINLSNNNIMTFTTVGN